MKRGLLLATLLVAAGLTAGTPAAAAPATADGFASVNGGTTGGVGGATVTVDTTDELLDAIETVGPLTIQVSGTIEISRKHGVAPNKTIIGVASNPPIAGGRLGVCLSLNAIGR